MELDEINMKVSIFILKCLWISVKEKEQYKFNSAKHNYLSPAVLSEF